MNQPATNPRFTNPPISGVNDVVDDVHPSRNLDKVMEEVLRTGTEETFCFLNEGQVRENVRMFQDHFMPDSPEERRIIYAMKANPRERVLQILAEEGIDGLDCASEEEIDFALSIEGIEPDGIYFNNPVKRHSDVRAAYRRDVSYFTAQSRSGVDKVLRPNELFVSGNLEVAARLETQNPDAVINLSEKYGCSPEEGLELLRRIEEAGARSGLAMHTGSQNGNPESFVRGIKLLKEVADRNGGVSSINLGGGIPVNYRPNQYNIREYLDGITRAVEEARADIFKGKVDDDPRVIIEPGRALIANAVDLLIPVLEIDENRRAGKRRVFMNDGIFTSFSDSPIHGWTYNFEVYTGDERLISTEEKEYTLFGRTCDSGDTLGGALFPRDLKEGDFLWVRNAGAYMDSQRSGFHGFGGPRYVSYNAG